MTQARITAAEVRRVAALARLGLTDDEVATFAPQLDAIVGYVAELATLELDGVAPTTHAVPLDCPLRADEPRPSTPREQVLAPAPRHDGQFFVVPRIIE